MSKNLYNATFSAEKENKDYISNVERNLTKTKHDLYKNLDPNGNIIQANNALKFSEKELNDFFTLTKKDAYGVVASDDTTIDSFTIEKGIYLASIALVSDSTGGKDGDNDDVYVYLKSADAAVVINQQLAWLRPESSAPDIRESGGTSMVFIEVDEASEISLKLYTDGDSTFGGVIYLMVIKLV